MYVMTIDQRGSRKSFDRVPELLTALMDVPALLAFERSVGDEVQGVLDSVEAVVEIAMRALRSGQWYVGIGIGAVDGALPASPREGSGTAFVLARQAVEKAKKTGERVPLSVQTTGSVDAGAGQLPLAHGGAPRDSPTGGGDPASAAEAVLVLIGDLVRKRSEAEWRVLDAMDNPALLRQVDVAQALGVSPQAVSKAILRSGRQEELAGRAAAALLLQLANR